MKHTRFWKLFGFYGLIGWMPKKIDITLGEEPYQIFTNLYIIAFDCYGRKDIPGIWKAWKRFFNYPWN